MKSNCSNNINDIEREIVKVTSESRLKKIGTNFGALIYFKISYIPQLNPNKQFWRGKKTEHREEKEP